MGTQGLPGGLSEMFKELGEDDEGSGRSTCSQKPVVRFEYSVE